MAKEAKISRIIIEETIKLELEKPLEWLEQKELAEDPNDFQLPREQILADIICELVTVLRPTDKIQHEGRLFTDLFNREKRASTALDHGVAVPHVRTPHIKDLAIGFARTSHPIEWGAMDGQPVDLFFVMAAPPYDDTLYNKLWQKLAGFLQFEDVRQRLRYATDPGEIIMIIRKEE